MDPVPIDLATIEEIRQVKYRYLRCVDLKLWDELAGVLTTGAASYQDRSERAEDGRWRMAHTGYVRTYEAMMALDDLPSFRITAKLGEPRNEKKYRAAPAAR